MYARACPRCRGDLFLHSDGFGSYLGCLQCGHTQYREEDAQESPGLFGRLSQSLADLHLRACPKCRGHMFLERGGKPTFRCTDCDYVLRRIDKEERSTTYEKLLA